MKEVKKDINTDKYRNLKERWQKIYNEFPMGFAFSADQLEEEKERLNIKSNNEILGIGIGGGFIKRSDKEAFDKMVKQVHDEEVKARDDDEFLYQMFVYEMGNCEYQLSGDTEYVLEVGCNMKLSDLKDKRILEIWLKAKRDFLEMCIANDWF